MSKIITYKILIVSMVFTCLFFTVNSCHALLDKSSGVIDEAVKQEDAFVGEAGFDVNTTVGDVVGSAVKAFIGFMGTVFIVLMVIGGWKYMMARGNEEKVSEALGLMRRAIIGLIIVAGAYSITYFVFRSIDWAGGGSGGNSGGVTDSGGFND